MSYHESEQDGLTTIKLTCDARKGKGACGNSAEVTAKTKEAVGKILRGLFGWGLLRGHQVCRTCLAKGVKNIHFPRGKA